MLKKSLLAISIFSQLLLVSFMTFVIYSKNSEPEIIENIFVETKKTTMEHTEPKEKLFNIPFKSFIESKGVVVPSSGYIKVSNPIEGVVEKVFVSIGDTVEKKTPIFKMSDKFIQVEIKQQEARLNKSIAKLNFLQQGPSIYAKLKKQKEIEEIEIRKASQEKEVSIFESLLEKSAVSCIEKDEKHMFLQITEKTLEKANAELNELNAKMTTQEEDIYLNDIEEKKAALKLSTLKLENSTLKAPLTGRVVDITVSEGQYLNNKGYSGVTIACEDPAMLKVTINENDAYKISNNKNLRAVAVHPTNPNIYFILDFISCNPKMSIYKNQERKLDVYFSFQKDQIPIYLEQSLKVYIETSSLNDLSFLHYKFK